MYNMSQVMACVIVTALIVPLAQVSSSLYADTCRAPAH
jgi:hypothetical protein